MRIRFETEGGFAHLPGLNRPTTLDTSDLSAKEAEELGRLVEEAGFFDLPETPTQSRSVADGRRYTITVSSPEREHTAYVEDPIEEAPLRALVDYLGSKARELRAAPRSRGEP